MDVMEINAITGEVTERDFTAAESKQRKTDELLAKNQAIAESAVKSNHLAIVKAVRDHAASLGFTDAMLAVMYPQLEEPPSE